MQSDIRYDLKLTGNGSSGGGVFRNVGVVGEATVDGDVDCLIFTCTGTTRVMGQLKSTSCHVTGELYLTGHLETGSANIKGTMEIDGSVKTREIRSRGEVRIRGGLAGEIVNLDGFLAIQGNCEAEQIRMRGMCTIDGLLNAGRVELHTHSKCRIREIGGETIDIRRGTGSVWKRMFGAFFLPADFFEGSLETDTIEGDEIYVEHTTAKAVRGTNVTIGPGCRIEQVEYTNRFLVADGSTVNRHAQV